MVKVKGLKLQLMFVQIISSTTKPFGAKLGIVIHHYKPECDAKELSSYLQGESHRKYCSAVFTVRITAKVLVKEMQSFQAYDVVLYNSFGYKMFGRYCVEGVADR